MSEVTHRQPATPEEVWATLREVSVSQRETDRRMQQTDRRTQEGELRGKVVTIEGLLSQEVPWSTIAAATGIDEPALRRLKRELAAADQEADPD